MRYILKISFDSDLVSERPTFKFNSLCVFLHSFRCYVYVRFVDDDKSLSDVFHVVVKEERKVMRYPFRNNVEHAGCYPGGYREEETAVSLIH